MAENKTYTIGYFPTTMPRDPVNIDLFLEHLAVGQVIETLIKIDTDGELVPNLAKSWSIQNDGKIFIFELRKDIHFSTGNILNCEDIKYSIERHQKNIKSQSYNYLKNIMSIECKPNNSIVFTLEKPQVSFLKILTRDHLGILPKNWEFNKENKEPWIGTGPYRFVIKEGKSYFIKNNLYRNANQVKIERWEALSSDAVSLVTTKVPDLLLHTPKEKVDEYIKLRKDFSTLQFINPIHFIQTSIWWHPMGMNNKNVELKKTIMEIFDDFVLNHNKMSKVELATGVIPRGVQGHIPERIKTTHKKTKLKNREIIKIAIFPNEFLFLSNDQYLKEQADLYNIELVFIKVDFEIKNFITIHKPDIVIATYAGGFNDPDGFLIVLGNILEIDPYKFLGPMKNTYTEASKNHNWTERGKAFRQINEYLVENQILVPGWKKRILIGKSSHLIENAAFYHYSLDLESFLPK